jgi:urease subunit gamma/beta
MRLTPAEHDRLTLFLATLLARERLARGVKLNVPEATALIAHAACEAARDGARLSDAIAAARAVLTPDDVLPEVPAIVAEVQVEAMFRDGTKLIVITDPIPNARPNRDEMPGAILATERTPPGYHAVVRVRVTNTSEVPVSVSSHFHFFETNRALAFDRAAAYGCRVALPVGEVARFEPGETRSLDLTPLGGDRRAIGFAGLVDGRLDAPGARDAALARARAAGYLDTESPGQGNTQ